MVGVTAIEDRVAAVTVNVVEPMRAPEVAVMVAVPIERAVVRPLLPAAFDTVAVASADDDQVTLSVRSSVVLSVYVPVAVNACVVAGLFGVVTGAVWWLDRRLPWARAAGAATAR